MFPPAIQALATDYDETIARMGTVPPETVAALERFRSSGRKLILDTGRPVNELLSACPRLDLFDRVVAENGAVLYRPCDGTEELLTPPLPPAFLMDLRTRGVTVPLRRVVIDTAGEHVSTIRDAARRARLELSYTFNSGYVIVLPKGVDKGTGLLSALAELGIAPENTVGIGDEANDHALLEACGFAVAVPHAVGTLKDRAHCCSPVVDLIDAILTHSEELEWGLRGSRAGLGNSPPLSPPRQSHTRPRPPTPDRSA